MAKEPTPEEIRKQKDARAKKLVLVMLPVLIALVAWQGPKVLNQVRGEEPRPPQRRAGHRRRRDAARACRGHCAATDAATGSADTGATPAATDPARSPYRLPRRCPTPTCPHLSKRAS